MSLIRFQLTLTAAAQDQLTATRKPARHVILESDDGNASAIFVGPSDVTEATGIHLNFSATEPGRLALGPFSGDAPLNTDEIFVAGAAGQIINALVVTH